MRESELEELVRETRPEPRPAFRAALDDRVSRRFEETEAPRRRRSATGPLLAVAATIVLAFLVAVPTIITGRGDVDESGSAAGGGGAAATPSSGGAVAESQRAPADPARPRPPGVVRGGSAPPSSGRARAVDRRTELELAAPANEFVAVTDGVLRVSDGVGAVVQRATVTERGGEGFATYDLRVPTARLDDALAQLSRLADVRSRTASSEDVTGATVSAQDRLDDARAERRAVLRALDEATGERLRELRARLRVLRGRIARAEAEVRGLRRRADLARVQVSVASTGEAGAWTPGDALRDAGRVLEVLAGVTLVALAVVGPFALLAALWVAAARAARRRRREAVLG
jgi:hypothetical protein